MHEISSARFTTVSLIFFENDILVFFLKIVESCQFFLFCCTIPQLTFTEKPCNSKWSVFRWRNIHIFIVLNLTCHFINGGRYLKLHHTVPLTKKYEWGEKEFYLFLVTVCLISTLCLVEIHLSLFFYFLSENTQLDNKIKDFKSRLQNTVYMIQNTEIDYKI